MKLYWSFPGFSLGCLRVKCVVKSDIIMKSIPLIIDWIFLLHLLRTENNSELSIFPFDCLGLYLSICTINVFSQHVFSARYPLRSKISVIVCLQTKAVRLQER